MREKSLKEGVQAIVPDYVRLVAMEIARDHVLIVVAAAAKMYVVRDVPILVALRVAQDVAKAAKAIATIYVLGAEICALKTA